MADRLSFLLSPFRPPTSYPVTLDRAETMAWLNGYAALWHPAALVGRTTVPVPDSVYSHDLPREGFLYVVPESQSTQLAPDWFANTAQLGATAFHATPDRAETFTNLLNALAATSPNSTFPEVGDEIVNQFTSIGYAYLMIDTLFDAMSHDKLLNLEQFWQSIQRAVELLAATPGELHPVQGALREAADQLRTAREGAFSGTIHLLELLLPSDEQLGQPWPAAVRSNVPISLLLSGKQLEVLSNQYPERLAELATLLPPGLPATAEACIGAYANRDDALLPIESQLWNLRKARQTCLQFLATKPTVYARARSAYHPHLPSWLQGVGYNSAVAQSFDGALVPTRYSSIVTWSGPDGKSIEAFSRDPLPADQPQTFFNLAYHLHQAITHDSNPTLSLLHKEPPTVGYSDYLASHTFGSLLGTATHLGRYFQDSHSGDYVGAATADEFFADYLDDRTTRRTLSDPVSGFVEHHRLRRKFDGASTLAALCISLNAGNASEAVATLNELENKLETHDAEFAAAGDLPKLRDELDTAETDFANQLAARVQVRSQAQQPGYLAFNTCAFSRRVTLTLPREAGPIAADGPVKSSEFTDGVARIVVEIPGLGYAWFPRGSAATSVPRARLKTADGTTVRNEFFEAELDPQTGGLRGFRDTRTRINRLGSFFVFNPGSKMVASTVRVTHAGAIMGEVTATGQITDEHNEPLAEFEHRIRAWVGRPVLEVNVKIQPRKSPSGYPWHAYYAVRFGWRDDRVATFRGVNGANTQSTHARPGSPEYLEWRLGRERTFLFTGGLPFAQRHGSRMMDLVLVPERETQEQFEFLIAADREHPAQTASGWHTPVPLIATDKGAPHIGASGWLAALDLPSLQLTALRPTASESGAAIVARLIETAGFAGAAELRFARDPARALAVDLNGEELHPMTMQDGAIPLEFSAGELFSVRAEWADATR